MGEIHSPVPGRAAIRTSPQSTRVAQTPVEAKPGPEPLAAREPFLEARGISKFFGHVTALDNVTVALYPGEVLALVGDNGAGKSTLVSILSGVAQPDAGSVWVDGNRERIDNPRRARALGIGAVFQDLALVDQRDVADNLFLGRVPTRLGIIVDRKRMIRESTAAIARLGVNLPSVRVPVAELSGGQRQGVAVARALLESARATLMDEPTAALGVREAAQVNRLISRLHEEGQAVLLVSHNLANVFALAHRAVVLRHGRIVGDQVIAESTPDDIVALITGAREGFVQ